MPFLLFASNFTKQWRKNIEVTKVSDLHREKSSSGKKQIVVLLNELQKKFFEFIKTGKAYHNYCM